MDRRALESELLGVTHGPVVHLLDRIGNILAREI
jgi:hypothetical protein